LTSRALRCFPVAAARSLLAAGLFFLAFVSGIPGQSAAPVPQAQRLTLEDVDGTSGRVDWGGSLPPVRWTRRANGAAPAYLETRLETSGQPRLFRVDAASGKATPFHDPQKMARALANAGMDRAAAQALSRRPFFAADDAETRALLVQGNDLWLYDFSADRATRVTDSPNEREQNPRLAPTGDRVAFVRGNNLYVADVPTGGALPRPPRALTRDGGPTVLNGRLDWIYEEEVYGRGNTTGFAWSPDGRRLAFLRLDEAGVPTHTLTDELARPPRVERQFYPKPGDPNPKVRLGVVAADGSEAAPHFVDLSAYPEEDRLVVRFTFAPDSRHLLYQVQNRTQTFLHLNTADVETGKVARLLEEKTPAWVNVLAQPRFLADGSFLWESERTGFRHLYRYRGDGTLVGAVTKGEWEVRRVHGVDEKGGWVYFSGTEHSPLGEQVYRVRLDGTGLTRLSRTDGDHNAAFDPTFTYYTDRWSDLNTPQQLRLHRAADGTVVRTLGENPRPLATRAPFRLGKPEIVRVPMRDGYELDAILLKPANVQSDRKYPVFFPVYGGPASPTVENAWETVEPWHHYLAQQGVAVFLFDPRSASGRGAKAAWTAYKALGASELRDLEDAVAWLKAQPWVDGDRLGLSGWSYGGFLTAYALTHSTAFKVGVVGAGVADWLLYDSIYTERYMGTPRENPDGYRASAPLHAAANLSGKLLLVHGTMDDNVHPENTLQFADALKRAGKSFDLKLYPRARHGIQDPAQARDLQRRLVTFLLENL